MRGERQHLWRKVRDAYPLFHRTEMDLMVKGNGISSVFLSSPHRLRTLVPIGEEKLNIILHNTYLCVCGMCDCQS